MQVLAIREYREDLSPSPSSSSTFSVGYWKVLLRDLDTGLICSKWVSTKEAALLPLAPSCPRVEGYPQITTTLTDLKSKEGAPRPVITLGTPKDQEESTTDLPDLSALPKVDKTVDWSRLSQAALTKVEQHADALSRRALRGAHVGWVLGTRVDDATGVSQWLVVVDNFQELDTHSTHSALGWVEERTAITMVSPPRPAPRYLVGRVGPRQTWGDPVRRKSHNAEVWRKWWARGFATHLAHGAGGWMRDEDVSALSDTSHVSLSRVTNKE